MTAPTTGAASLASSLLSTASQIGRYFSLTSALPASALVLWTYVLVASGAAAGRPHLDKLGGKFSPTFTEVGLFVLVVILVGIFLHPLQFGMTQLLEGYWGTRRLPLLLSSVRTNFYRRRIRHLEELTFQHSRDSFRELGIEVPDDDVPSDQDWRRWERRLHAPASDRVIRHVLGRNEAMRKRAELPDQRHRVMPTRLGNALRRYEELGGAPYGIDAIATAPHFSLVAKPEHRQYVEDELQQMDTALRTCVIAIIATIETVAMLFTDGPWLFVALVPYGLAYLAYRGTVAAARSYGTATSTLIDLNRFALYESLHLPRPTSLYDERERNKDLMDVITRSDPPDLRYRPEPGNPPLRGSLRTRRSAIR